MFELIVLIVVVLMSSALAYLVYKSNSSSDSNKWFALFACSIIFWSIIMYLSLAFDDLQITLFFIRLSMLAGTLLAISAFIFAYTFPNTHLQLPKYLKIFFLIFGPLTMMVSMSPYMFTDIRVIDSNIEPTPGPGILLFVITAIGSVLATFVTLIYKFVKAKSLQRTQYFFMILGILLMFVLLVTTNFLTVVLWKNSSLIFLAPVYPLLYLSTTAYAIFRHRILDIKLLLVRAMSYFLTILLLASLISILLYLSTLVFTRFTLPISQVVFFIVFSILFALFFQPIRRIFEEKTEKLFYRNEYDTSDVLSELSAVIASTIIFDELINKVGDIFTAKVKVSTFWILLYGDRDYSSLFQNVKYVLPQTADRSQIENFVKKIYEYRSGVIFSEEEEDQSIRTMMDQLQVSVISPLIVNHKIVGAYLVGPKSSGDSYSQRDLDVMEISAPQLATGIQNALSYEEIKRFNVTLQEKVDAATAQLRVTNSQLKASNDKLQELDRLKDEFVSIASHELRTPLTAIKGYLWLALHKSTEPLSDEVSKNLQIAHDASERLSVLVEDMLTTSRIESGRIKFDIAQYDMIKLATEVRDELKVRADEKKINLILETTLTTLQVTGDKDRTREVMINLIGNALKFTPEGGKITLRISQSGDQVIFEVKDTGPGLSKEDIDKLFQKFSKLDHSYANTKETGTGLGLYISKQIVILQQGSISIESELGKGTNFIVKLPLVSHVEKSDNES